MRRIPELDGLRAVAILLVIGCHYPGFASLAGGLPEFGWLGVDIFFVLSGYLITTILLGLRNHSAPYATFYGRRIVRIFPPYFAVTLFILVLAIPMHAKEILNRDYLFRQFFFLQAFDFQYVRFLLDVLRHFGWCLQHLASLTLNAHHLPGSWSGAPLALSTPAATYWSLSIEEYFYLFWAPVMLRLSRRWIASIAVLVCLTDALLRWITPASFALYTYFSVFCRFDGLLYGALLALLLERYSRRKTSIGLLRVLRFTFAACVGTIACMLFAIRPVLGREIRSSPLVLVIGLPLFCVAVACLIGLLVQQPNRSTLFARLLRTPVLQNLGTISYAMYLVHLLVAYLVFRLGSLFSAATGMQSPKGFALAQAIISLAITIFAGRGCWHFLEKPLLRWKNRRFPSAPHPSEPLLD